MFKCIFFIYDNYIVLRNKGNEPQTTIRFIDVGFLFVFYASSPTRIGVDNRQAY